MARVLLAGASGTLGSAVAGVLKARARWTRALCRSSARAGGLPVDEVAIAGALRPESLTDVAEGIDVIVSCLGQTVSADMSICRPGYRDVDVPANLNLLDAARRAPVRRFVYVSVLHAENHPRVACLDAHARVATAVRGSGLSHGIVEPTGFFSAFKAFLDMAQQGASRPVRQRSGAIQSN